MSRARTILVCILILTLSVGFTVSAQENPPDYRVQALGSSLSPDETEIIISYGVTNIGGPADEPASVRVVDLSNGETVAEDTDVIVPLQGNGATVAGLTIRIPVTRFDPGSNVALQLAVGVNEVEPDDNLTIFNNYDGISVQVPFYNGTPVVEPTPRPEQPGVINAPEQAPETLQQTLSDLVGVDLTESRNLLILGAIALCVVIILILLWLIVRLLFQRTPKFGTWQPPYATMPPLDPNSTYGRRQAWQQHAQNNVLPVPCQPGVIHARKLLLGMDGVYLSSWRIKALRLTQYDMYGRVSRSQVLASGDVVARLSRISRRVHRINLARLGRRVRPAARSLATQFLRKITRRSAMLPIALDVRLRGTHGEVRIVFELYDCQQRQPRQIDTWEPEMTVLGKTIYESYTYSLYGQTGGESYREFKRRLREDLERVLVELLMPLPQPAELPPVDESTRPVLAQTR
ncbi:MAG: hypothetical protein OHK0046_19690 [Anaerolineae bacterium]